MTFALVFPARSDQQLFAHAGELPATHAQAKGKFHLCTMGELNKGSASASFWEHPHRGRLYVTRLFDLLEKEYEQRPTALELWVALEDRPNWTHSGITLPVAGTH